jgi:hypothetical protein
MSVSKLRRRWQWSTMAFDGHDCCRRLAFCRRVCRRVASIWARSTRGRTHVHDVCGVFAPQIWWTDGRARRIDSFGLIRWSVRTRSSYPRGPVRTWHDRLNRVVGDVLRLEGKISKTKKTHNSPH